MKNFFNFFKKEPKECQRCSIIDETVKSQVYGGSFALFCSKCQEQREIVGNLGKPIIDAYLEVQGIYPEVFSPYNYPEENLKPFLKFEFGKINDQDEEDENFSLSNDREIKNHKIEPSSMQAILTSKNVKTRLLFKIHMGIFICNKFTNGKFIKSHHMVDHEYFIDFINTQVKSFILEEL